MFFVGSAFVSLGSYSTGPTSQSGSVYLTLSDSWRHYYTVSFQSLTLRDGDVRGKYFAQQFGTARISWLLGARTNVALHYAFLHEGEIKLLSAAGDYHFLGAGASYWILPTLAAGSSGSLSLSHGKVQSTIVRSGFSFWLGKGIWATTSVNYSGTDWSHSYWAVRQSVSLPLGNRSTIWGTAVLGRRVFYFDDELLLIYNQREVQKLGLGVGGGIRVYGNWYLLPSAEYDRFEGYEVSYGSIGIRVIL